MDNTNKVVMKYRGIFLEHTGLIKSIIGALEKAHADFKSKEGTPMAYTTGQRRAILDGILRSADESARTAEQKIDTILNATLEALERKYTMRGDAITPDLQLLNGAFSLSADSLRELHGKYQNNPTMTNAIRKYVKDHDIRDTGLYFRTQEDEARVYTAYAKQAKDSMRRLNMKIEDVSIGTNLAMLENYGLDYTNDNWQVIGDGQDLQV